MIKINEHYLKLQASYLFSDIDKRVTSYKKKHPEHSIIKLGIGDVTRALPRACVDALHKAADEMACDATFRGYAPGLGYDFLREVIAREDYQKRGISIEADEIFISDGAKCDTGNFQEIFGSTIRVAIPDPVYPAYVDTNVMAGRTGTYHNGRYLGLYYLESTKENGFIPELPREPVDLIYLCYPNNPTGATIRRAELKRWVDFAIRHKAIILYDAAYEAFIRDDSLPKSIFEIEGAEKVAVEFRSFSKTAGFTGMRCGFTVVPKSCTAYHSENTPFSLHTLWQRRHTTKFNGVAYPIQRAAEAVYSPEGKKEIRELTDYYLKNAQMIRIKMTQFGFECTGGDNSPYIWINCQKDSWQFFDLLLEKAGVVCTPGEGFGHCGKGYIRISAFNTHENVSAAMERIQRCLGGI